jgi:hypothetical protein
MIFGGKIQPKKAVGAGQDLLSATHWRKSSQNITISMKGKQNLDIMNII